MNSPQIILRNNDLKSTPARLAILSFLSEQSAPRDVEDIIVHIANEHETVDRVTVYRILETFVKKGLIKRLEFGEGKYRYELAGDDHHHLICESCGKVEDISDCHISDLEKEISQRKKFLVKRHQLEFFGVCRSCQR